ncbi:MAG: hypothetical protein LBI02_02645 [Opitutaceae bacterium]|jgi:hypothetical protein|nr:hypothetical protein [Opitutaceae bacterium]
MGGEAWLLIGAKRGGGGFGEAAALNLGAALGARGQVARGSDHALHFGFDLPDVPLEQARGVRRLGFRAGAGLRPVSKLGSERSEKPDNLRYNGGA